MTEAKIVKLQTLTFLAVKSVREEDIVFVLYEPVQDTDSKKLHRVFDGVKGVWKLFIMPLSWSSADGAMLWALEQIQERMAFRRFASSVDNRMQAVVSGMAAVTRNDESIHRASKQYFTAVEDYTRAILVAAFPEAKQAVANGSLWFHLPIARNET